MADIKQPKAPEGYGRLEGGLIVPEEYAKNPLNQNNQKLLGLKEKLDINTLESAILDNYLAARKQQDGDKTLYNKPVSVDQASEIILEQMYHHVHTIHFEGMKNKYKSLKEFTDFNGTNYLDVVMKGVIGLNERDVKEMLEKNPLIDNNSMIGNAKRVASTYLQTQAVPFLQDMYKEDNLTEMKEGLINLGETFKLTEGRDAIFKVKDVQGSMDYSKTFQAYMQSLFTAWQKIEMGPIKEDEE